MGCGDAVLNEERGVTWRWSEFDRFAALHGYRIKAHDVLTWSGASHHTTTSHHNHHPRTFQAGHLARDRSLSIEKLTGMCLTGNDSLQTALVQTKDPAKHAWCCDPAQGSAAPR